MDGVDEKSSAVQLYLAAFQRRFQKILDDTTPYPEARWGFTAFVAFLYILRVFLAQGWYIVTYVLGIYLLNMFLAFLQPKFDPAMDEAIREEEEEGPVLPMKSDEEFKPFIRRLPEFKFWYATTSAFLIALVCAFIKALDLPVFWPILLIYFIILFTITMKRQIRHMIKYRYIPFDIGKKRYSASGPAASVKRSN
ncbi:retention in endoplasmic reticulum protein 1 [Nowakowskiella sp. JEL0407]|nr:retention in endoplasmic reticulum protein 1 [Nowakowskiella sp. JEL0407]